MNTNGKVDFMIRVNDYKTPLKNSITIYDIISFYQLLIKKGSKFEIWFNKNRNTINKIIRENDIKKVIFLYYQDDIDEIIRRAEVIIDYLNYSHPIDTKLETEYRKPIKIVSGGNRGEILHFVFELCTSILFYVFIPDNITLAILPKPIEKIMYGGNGRIGSIKNVSRRKDKLVYIISINDNKYVLKISEINRAILAENRIYKELTEAQKNDAIIRNYIIKSYGSGTLESSLDTIEFVDSMGVNININREFDMNIKLYSEIKNFKKENKYTLLNYLVLEYCPYPSLESNIINLSGENVCILYDQIIKKLIHLYEEYGFSHLDLHGNNVLVTDNPEINFRIFDFDTSTTLKNPNDSFFKHPFDIMNKEKNPMQLFLIYDVLRVSLYAYDYVTVRTDDDIIINNDLPECKDKLKNIFNTLFEIHYEIDKANLDAIDYFITIQDMTIKLRDFGFYDVIMEYVLASYGGNRKHYYKKYIKYKTKYLEIMGNL